MQHLEVAVWLNFFRKEKRKLILFPFCWMVNLALLAPRPKIANYEPNYTRAKIRNRNIVKWQLSKPEIAERLKKDVSKTNREIKRNCDKRNNKYRAVLAHRRCEERHSNKNKNTRFTAEFKDFVEHWVKQEYRREQIVGRAKEQGLNCLPHE